MVKAWAQCHLRCWQNARCQNADDPDAWYQSKMYYHREDPSPVLRSGRRGTTTRKLENASHLAIVRVALRALSSQ